MSRVAYDISLTVIAILTGIAILPVFGRFSDAARLSLAKRKIRAALYSFRLFGDQPRLVFRAQGQLLAWNARYIGLMLRPSLILVVPVLLLLWQMDAIYGRRAFHTGETAIVTAQVANGIDLNQTSPVLGGYGVTVQTLPLRIPAEHRVLWRIQTDTPGSDSISLSVPGTSRLGNADDPVIKNIRVGSGWYVLSERRVASYFGWLLAPWESRLPANSPVRSIGFQYPGAEFRLFGFGMPWIVWFVIVSWITAFVFRKRFGVVL